MGTFLAIQWLSLHTSSTGSAGLIPGKRTKITSATWSKKQQQSIKLNKIPLYPILFSIFFYWKLLEMLSGSQSLIPLHPFSFEPNPFRQSPITPMKLHSPIFPWLGWLHISVCTVWAFAYSPGITFHYQSFLVWMIKYMLTLFMTSILINPTKWVLSPHCTWGTSI